VIDFGVSHTRIAIADMAGNLLYNEQVDSVIVSESAPEVVRRLWETLADRLDGLDGPGGAIRGIAIGVPAPIAQPSGRMVSPAFMPSWNNVSLPALFESHTDVPVVVENDANLFALAELSTNTDIESSNLIAVKLGTRIGSGLISSGRIHRGHNGAAGEASHTTVSGISAIDCSCNVENCLESVASGGAIIARLNASGVAAESTSDVIRLTQAGHPQALDIVRDAGKHIGAALSGFVNFFNPHEVILGGAMASCAPLVASIRSELFHSCLPIVTADLDVRTSTSQTSSAVLGGIRLLLDTIHSPAEIDRLVARSSESNIA
jgi:predicted NBD/HSP70 family sugar kinase